MIRALGICLCLVGTTAATANESDWQAWAEAAHRQHALAGRVYEVASGKLSSPSETHAPVLPDGIVVLGEVHDNPDHHRVRAWLIAETAQARPRWRPAVVFEQIGTDQQPALDRFKALADAGSPSATADELFRLLQWEKSGWPPAKAYRPLLAAVVAARLPILAGNLPRRRVHAVARGETQVAPAERARLRLDAPMPVPLADALRRELADSHCGALPPQAIAGMMRAQRYRDAHLADVALGAAARHGSAILIVGNGHARSDRGVPWHIRQRAPEARVTSVLVVEVEEGKTEPATYLPRDPEGRPAADLVIFTPRVQRDDPCQRLLKSKR